MVVVLEEETMKQKTQRKCLCSGSEISWLEGKIEA
jgi:hypothetical protein